MQPNHEDSQASPCLPGGSSHATNQQANRRTSQCGVLPAPHNVYGPVNITGGSLHQGDQYYVSNEDTAQKDIDRFLGSLRFSDINLRANQIVDAHRKTFEWALNDPPYPLQPSTVSTNVATWLVSSEPMFWVAGKPGSGKSTLMKFLSSHKKTFNLLKHRFHNRNVLILRHFFWLHGSEMQRTMKGCLCTLVYQMLHNDDRLVLAKLQENSSLREKHNIHDWSESELQGLLFGLLSSEGRAFGIFLDGLDEYDMRSDMRMLIDFVCKTSQMERVKLCGSSRQENVFERAFQRRPKLRLQDLTYNDMRDMARLKMVVELEEAEFSLTNIQLEELSDKIASRAEGVFLWAAVAIKALTTGIRDCEEYKALYEDVNELPSEMEELCRLTLLRVNGNGRTNVDSCLLYLALAKHSSISLLAFTLAADEQLLRRFLDNRKPFPSADLEQLLKICKRMESKIRARTAGLLEAVHASHHFNLGRSYDYVKLGEPDGAQVENQHRSNTGSRSDVQSLCTCSTGYRGCFTSLPHTLNFHLVHLVKVRYMHRDLAEHFDFAKTLNVAADREKELHLRSWRNVIVAKLVERKLGCHCASPVPMMTELWHMFSAVGECYAWAFTDQIIDGSAANFSLSERYGCCYGWGHEICNKHARLSLATEHHENSHSLATCDFPGLLAGLGYLRSLSAISSEASSWSAYYKGYLCVCALKRVYIHDSNHGHHYSEKTRLLVWLIDNGADLLSPQVALSSSFGLDFDESLTLQTPMIDSWCFILRLLEESFLSREERLRICKKLVPSFLARGRSFDGTIAWSVRINARPGRTSNMQLYHLEDYKLQFIFKTTMQKLQACALNGVWCLQKGHQYRQESSFLSIEDICYVSWDTPDRLRGHGRVNHEGIGHIDFDDEDNCYEYASDSEGRYDTEGPFLLSVSTIRSLSLETALSAALKILVSHECRNSQPFGLLIRELEKYRTQDPLGSRSDIFKVTKDSTFHAISVAKALNVAPYHSFYMFLGFDINLVPPDRKKELRAGQWYEHGALREWHERRRRKIWNSRFGVQRGQIADFERQSRSARPSYLPSLTDRGKGSELKNCDSVCQNAVGSLEARQPLPTHRETTNDEATDVDSPLHRIADSQQPSCNQGWRNTNSIQGDEREPRACPPIHSIVQDVLDMFKDESDRHSPALSSVWSDQYVRVWE